MSQYQLMQGRLAELEGKPEDAVDSYGQVIAADFRPTRAEAVYRTLKLLNEAGKRRPRQGDADAVGRGR